MIVLMFVQIVVVVGGDLCVVGEDMVEIVVDGIVDIDFCIMIFGLIFVVKFGVEMDGYCFVGVVVVVGVVFVIVEYFVDVVVSQIVVFDVVVVFGVFVKEVVVCVCVGGELWIVGIIGLNGKIMIKNFFVCIFEGEGEIVVLIKFFNNEVGVFVMMFCVIECIWFLVSEFGVVVLGSIVYFVGFVELDIVVVLMVGMVYVGGFGGIEVIVKVKVEFVVVVWVFGIVVFNVDDVWVVVMWELVEQCGLCVVGFGQGFSVDVCVYDIQVFVFGIFCVIEVVGEWLLLYLCVFGVYYVLNVLVVIVFVFVFGVVFVDVIVWFEMVEIVEWWCMQLLGNDWVWIINDVYNVSFDLMVVVLCMFVQIIGLDECIVVVFGVMNEFGESVGEEYDWIGLFVV